MNNSPLQFPRSVAKELARRRTIAETQLAGKILDLSNPVDRLVVVGAIDGNGEPEWDGVLSVGELTRFPDLAAAVVAIESLIAPTGRFVAIEPVMRPGTLRMIAATPFNLSRRTGHLHLGRDLPAALRATSLGIDDIERVTMRTSILPLRHFVSLSARRAILPPEISQ